MDQNKLWGPPGFNFGPIVISRIYINDLPKAIQLKAIPIFTEDTSILITNPNNIQFQNNLNVVFGQINKWFKANLLTLNFDKIYCTQCTNNSTHVSDIHNMYEDKQICTAIATIVVGLFINNTVSWKTHIECIKSKLGSAYAVRSVKPYVSINALKMIYHSYCHSVMTYGLLF
jgi:hypothetical protein